MAQFLTTLGITAKIEEIINNSKQYVILISPFLKFSDTILERIQDASLRGVPIILVYGKKELNDTQYNELLSIKGLTLTYYENLHAKCYYNEKEMLITSMNLYDTSIRNREMGISIRFDSDKELFDNAVQESNSIIQHSQRVSSEPQGYCIHCGAIIPFNPNAPFCIDCYRRYKYQAPQPYCHACGRQCYATELDRPLCYSCYKSIG